MEVKDKTIKINKETHKALKRIKVDKELKTIDDVIIYLLKGGKDEDIY